MEHPDILSPIFDMFQATSQNGDDLKQKWLKFVLPLLQQEAGVIAGSAQNLISQFSGGSRQFQELVMSSETRSGVAIKVMRLVTSFRFRNRLEASIVSSVRRLINIYLGFAENTYLAASTALVEGLSQQLQMDELLKDTQVTFEHTDADKILEADLILDGLPFEFVLRSRVISIFSDQWFASAVGQAVSAKPTLPMVTEALQNMVAQRKVTVERALAQIALALAHFSVRKATLQFNSVKVAQK